MRVLITGANGQLGKELVRLLSHEHQVFGLSRRELDVREIDSCLAIIKKFQPDVIVHLAAYTAVDLAESNETEAYSLNAYGSRNVAIAANEIGAKVCYVSTDYVFDGLSSRPYQEYDSTNPINVYGKTKRVGECYVSSLCPQFFIVRTAWVYGKEGHNFVKTMLKLAKEREQIKVVNDQVGSPTYTVDLCNFLSALIKTSKYGIYHATNSGSCSWYDFAKAIFEIKGIQVRLESCVTSDYPRPAARPKFSVMDHAAIQENGFDSMPHWREALERFLKSLEVTE